MNSTTERTHQKLIQEVQEVFGSSSLDKVGITSPFPEGSSPESSPVLNFNGKAERVVWREQIYQSLLDMSMYPEARKWRDCGQKGIVLRCQNNPDHTYYVPFHCDLRICPVCGNRYAARIRKQYRAALEELGRISRRNGKNLKLLTLTKRSDNELTPESIRDFQKKVGRMIRKFYDGGLSVREVGKGFNLHAHAIVFGEYVPQAELSKAWLKLTGDSQVIDIRRVKRRKIPLTYILKYISKPCKFDRPEDYVVYLKAIRGTRRVHSYGALYGIKPSESRKDRALCPQCGGFLRYDRELSREFSTRILLFHLGVKPYSYVAWKAQMTEA